MLLELVDKIGLLWIIQWQLVNIRYNKIFVLGEQVFQGLAAEHVFTFLDRRVVKQMTVQLFFDNP
ncbi:hypothetical protein D3C72_1203090 [compost metagenome]